MNLSENYRCAVVSSVDMQIHAGRGHDLRPFSPGSVHAEILKWTICPPTGADRLIAQDVFLFSGRELTFTFAICHRPSVCRLSVCNVGAPYSGGCNFRQFFAPYDSPGTLVFCCHKLLVGDAPFPVKFAFKVTHPLFNCAISTNIGS